MSALVCGLAIGVYCVRFAMTVSACRPSNLFAVELNIPEVSHNSDLDSQEGGRGVVA